MGMLVSHDEVVRTGPLVSVPVELKLTMRLPVPFTAPSSLAPARRSAFASTTRISSRRSAWGTVVPSGTFLYAPSAPDRRDVEVIEDHTQQTVVLEA